MKIIIGVDPGFSGALVTMSVDGAPLRTVIMPVIKSSTKIKKKSKDGTKSKTSTKSKTTLDMVAITKFFDTRKKAIRHVFIEQVGAMPGQGVVSMFRFGEGYGFLQGICAGLRIPFSLIHPVTWKRIICHGIPKGKASGILVAQRLWPTANILDEKGKHHDGIADALCIAEYGRRMIFRGGDCNGTRDGL